MALKTPDQFMESLKKRKSMNIWFNGEKLSDPTEAPALQPSAHTIRKVYEIALHPKLYRSRASVSDGRSPHHADRDQA